jgi:hypothetical protein
MFTPNTDTTATTLRTQTMTSTTRLNIIPPGDTVNIIPVLSYIMLYNPNEIIHFDLTATPPSLLNYTLAAEFVT